MCFVGGSIALNQPLGYPWLLSEPKLPDIKQTWSRQPSLRSWIQLMFSYSTHCLHVILGLPWQCFHIYRFEAIEMSLTAHSLSLYQHVLDFNGNNVCWSIQNAIQPPHLRLLCGIQFTLRWGKFCMEWGNCETESHYHSIACWCWCFYHFYFYRSIENLLWSKVEVSPSSETIYSVEYNIASHVLKWT